MTAFDTIKSLAIFFAPILIPRAISLVQSTRRAIAQQRHVPRQPLTPQASRALNILFFSTALFLLLSLPMNPYAPISNVFSTTSSRFSIPTDLLFTRISRTRPLTPIDSLLRTHFTSPQARKTYLRFGPETLLSCAFCGPDSPNSYLIYHIPFNILLPHLFHLFVIGIATSAPLVGPEAARWRKHFLWAAFILLFADLGVVASYNPYTKNALNTAIVPWSLYTLLYTVRTLAFTIFDAWCASLIYLSATNRFFFGAMAPTVSADQQVDQFVELMGSNLTSAMGKLHALGLLKNTVMHDAVLKQREDAVWADIVRRTGGIVGSDGTSVFDDEEVVQAISRALAKRAQEAGDRSNEADIMKEALKEASNFVEGATAGLELEA
ncbi:hypothetical protein LOZ53_003378 [Ophidiomyces ophidiicola]|nr:hypothetical protein LOZ55_004942 [Ophidiomyces ophidiicola]KAI1987297.1 hypothetical protein LOZ51_005764 [Ophidiomyces ophidiicola]KAI1990019.1 hypothetical protein LOZ53_003378 [Ophidiomyces ophidiicola]KAI1990223.1 hypothetical protein LOZ54_002548 [Ophidiomyces ophidiicola]